ncbi:MAG: ABC transporter permease, partial [Eubacterium sp.]|nr:ABC transporter permease [Eubacterium sp.]
FLTELTETAVAVLAQGVWWFAAIFGGVQRLKGGMYGWNLVPRHNTQMNWQGFQDGFAQLAANRIFYAVLSLLLVMGTAFIFEQKRKGRLHIRGKILAHRKNKS